MYSLPTYITIDGIDHPITNKGDYRMIIEGCFHSLNDPELDKEFRVISSLICFYEELDDIDDLEPVFGDKLEDAVTAMYDFFNCNQLAIGAKVQQNLVDWEKDAQMISAAVNRVAPQRDIRDENEYVHWFTFMGYYLSIGECIWAQIIAIRDKIVNHKQLDKFERKFKQDNPEYFIWGQDSIEQKEAEDLMTQFGWNQ